MSDEPASSSSQESVTRNRPAVIFGIIAVVALIAVCILAILLIRSSLDGDEDQVTDAGAPTPFPTLDGSQGIVAPSESLVVGISDSATVSVTLDVPVSLLVGGERFPVSAANVAGDGRWSPELEGDRTAIWVFGTIVNYVVGLPDTSENSDLLRGLDAGQEMVLTTRGGTDYTFTVNRTEMVSSGSAAVFAQNTPGLTLILLGSDGDERLVVRGRYVVPEARGTGGQSPVLELGETAQLEDVQLTVTGATYLLDRPEAPAGFAFYLVDFQAQNVGLTALDTNNLRLTLMDELGNQYAVSPVASQLGNYRPLGGFLNSNQSIDATAGYQIPIGLSSPALSWVASRLDTGGQVQVTIPFTAGPATASGARVSLARAEVSQDLTSLILGGQVSNPGDQPLLVAEEEVVLRTADGSVYLLLSTNPPFPWTVAAGQSVQFVVTVQRPLSASTAIFTVLNQPFELSGLR